MSNTVLLVFEGEKIEGQIFNSIKSNFFPSSGKDSIIRSSFKGEIYQLWNKIKDDEFIDILEILKDRPDSDIKDLNRKDVSAIHLFFDHDPHSHPEKTTHEYNELIKNMLIKFNNEFDQGKLWLSYPMIEAIKHCKSNSADCFLDAKLKISDNTIYKDTINKISDFLDIRKYDESIWYYITMINIQRTFCLVNDCYENISDYKSIKSWFDHNAIITKLIQDKQYEKFILPKNEIVALSPFPHFLINYFGESYFNKCKDVFDTKNCSFFCYQ